MLTILPYPPRATNAGGNYVQTAPFDSPPCLLVAVLDADQEVNEAASATITNNGTPLTWEAIGGRSFPESPTKGFVAAFAARLPASRPGLVVTAHVVNADSPSLKVYCVGGADDVALTIEGNAVGSAFATEPYLAPTSGLAFAVGVDWEANGLPAAIGMETDSHTNAAQVSGFSTWRHVAKGEEVICNVTAPPGSPTSAWNWIVFHINPLTLPWWQQETNAMAAETWMAEQDRSGLTLSPAFEVPPGKSECKMTIVATGFSNEAQGIEAELRLSMNNKQSFQPGGGGNFWGGAVSTGKNGQPGERSITCQLLPDLYPTHAQVALNVAGVVNCGVSVEFLPAS